MTQQLLIMHPPKWKQAFKKQNIAVKSNTIHNNQKSIKSPNAHQQFMDKQNWYTYTMNSALKRNEVLIHATT